MNLFKFFGVKNFSSARLLLIMLLLSFIWITTTVISIFGVYEYENNIVNVERSENETFYTQNEAINLVIFNNSYNVYNNQLKYRFEE